MMISQMNPELVFNAFRLANFSRKEGDEVKVFLLGEVRRVLKTGGLALYGDRFSD